MKAMLRVPGNPLRYTPAAMTDESVEPRNSRGYETLTRPLHAQSSCNAPWHTRAKFSGGSSWSVNIAAPPPKHCNEAARNGAGAIMAARGESSDRRGTAFFCKVTCHAVTCNDRLLRACGCRPSRLPFIQPPLDDNKTMSMLTHGMSQTCFVPTLRNCTCKLNQLAQLILISSPLPHSHRPFPHPLGLQTAVMKLVFVALGLFVILGCGLPDSILRATCSLTHRACSLRARRR